MKETNYTAQVLEDYTISVHICRHRHNLLIVIFFSTLLSLIFPAYINSQIIYKVFKSRLGNCNLVTHRIKYIVVRSMFVGIVTKTYLKLIVTVF